MSAKKYKISFLTSQVIADQVPIFKKLAKHPDVDLTVYFCWDIGVTKEGVEEQFGTKVRWDKSYLEGYKYKFLKNFSPKPSNFSFGQINLGIISEILKGRFDVVVVHGYSHITEWFAFFGGFLSRTPIFLRGETPLNQELLNSKNKLRIKKIVLGLLFKIIKVFLYLGEENKNFYKHYGAPDRKLFFTPYAVDNERFRKAARDLKDKREGLRNNLGIKKDDVAIIFTGKLIPKKRPMELLKAYEMLANDNTHLIFVGSGELEDELKEYTKDNNLKNVHLAGFKNQTELPEYYTMADIFVLPSGVGETWGLVVNEAMNFGLPIIVSDIVGCGHDLVRAGENGYVFPLGDIKKLSEYLKSLIEDPDKREAFGRKSFEIIEGYSYEKDVEGILEALRHGSKK